VTLILNAADVAGLLDPGVLLDALRSGFLAGGPSTKGQRVRADLPGPGTATVLLPGLVDGIPAYTVKVNAKFPAARPALRGVVCLHSLEDGRLLAILDSASLTAWRTGLAAALATDVLAPPGAGTVGVVGAGAQAELVLAGLRRLRPVTRLTVTDLDQDRARRLAERHGGPGRVDARVDARVADGAREVAAASEIVVLATWSRAPLLHLADLRPGQHVTSLGVDEPGKAELARDVLRSATLVVDDEDLVRQAGVLAPEGLRDVRPALLGQVLAGTHPGRSASGELTVYAPVGLPWQDLVAAWAVYQAASRPGHGAANPVARPHAPNPGAQAAANPVARPHAPNPGAQAAANPVARPHAPNPGAQAAANPVADVDLLA
jgi:alanine dehydrogenase